VLVTYSGNAKLVDFGIAKATARGSSATQAGEIKGKFAYMAPEQVSGDVIDRRTDIFGMGVILYLLTTGRHPFKGVHPAETLQNICAKKPPRAPSAVIPGYPPELEAVVMQALAKAPDERWPTANDMLSALEKAMPQSLDGSFEVQVADYMNELLGDRVRERRMQLRVAQELADRVRPEGALGTPGSYGSLRALSVGGDGGTGSGISAGTGSHSSSSRMILDPRLVHSLPGFEAPRPDPMKRLALLLGVAAGAVALVALGQFVHWAPPSGTAVATNPVPSVAPPSPPVVEEPRAIPSATVAPVASPPPHPEPAEDRRDLAPNRRGRPPPRIAPRTSTASSPSPGGAPSSPAAVESGRSKDHEGVAPNAWDPGSFGGRR
jgi:eukaryotic-like serine/threonine-protein kinase